MGRLAAALLVGAACGAMAAEGDPPAPSVGLDRLLELPDSLEFDVERRGGATAGEWRERFREAEKSLQEARSALSATEAELASLGESSDGWTLAPPGGGTAKSDAPLSYQLKMQIRRQRDEVARAEKELRELQIEANLADVPERWRR